MRQEKNTTNPTSNQAQQNFFNAPALNAIAQSEPKITVNCDLCADCATGTRHALDAQGWGMYGDFEFCPHHESMI